MKDNNKHRKNKFLALFLSVLMVSSAAAAMAACGNDSTTSESESESTPTETTTVTDNGLVKNAGFETFDTNDGLNAIGTSVSNWSRSLNSTTSGNAPSSKAASGIIDLNETEWNKLTGSYFEDPEEAGKLTEAKAIELWDKLTTRDKLAYYEKWKDDNEDGKIAKDFEKYEAFNIDLGDVPEDLEKFSTHHKDGDEGYGKDTKVLMIHNENPEDGATATYQSIGSAQKYTSSSTVTVPANAAAKFSVWVKTANLMSTSSSGAAQEAVNKGAYISLTHSVGGKSLPAYEVKNINTDAMDESSLSNGWAQYTFYIKGSSYADTTFTAVLGLGQGSNTDRHELVSGYAFFDDIECEIISQADYEDDVTNNVKVPTIGFASEKAEKTFDVSQTAKTSVEDDLLDGAIGAKGKFHYALDFHGEFREVNVLGTATAASATTTDEIDGKKYTSMQGNTLAPWLGDGRDGSKDVTAVFANAAKIGEGKDVNSKEYTNNKYLAAVYNNYFKDVEFAKDSKTLLLMSAQGVAYTAESGYTFKFVDDKGTAETSDDVDSDYIAISFFVKTSDLKGYTGAGVTLMDGDTEAASFSLDTTDITPVELGGDKDYYDGWQQCFFFVKNASEADVAPTFTLKFNFGPTTIDTTSTLDSFHTGFAAFTNFQVYHMSKQEYDSAASGTYAKTVSVTGTQEEKPSGNGGFDSEAAVASSTHSKLKDGIANPLNYKGVYSDSYYVAPPTSDITDNEATQAAKTAFNTYANAGLLSREHFTAEDGYFSTATGAWMNGIKTIAGSSATTAEAVWKSVFDTATQPLFIWNDGANEKAYGFIGKSTSVSANNYAAVSVRVKVGSTVSGATPKAYIYLIDTDDKSYANALSIGRNLTYWYDEDGNVLSGDPAEKDTMIALYRQSNGVYKINAKWATKNNLTFTDAQLNESYANLQAYPELDAKKNKLVAANGASHAYSDYWNNEGEDGIAFYYRESDGAYCADRALTLPVADFSTITGLTPRNSAIENKALVAEVSDTKGAWATVTFYIHAGDDAKNYRLEVWSGDRNAENGGNAAGTYVIFDANNPGEAEANFGTLLPYYKDMVGENDKFESVFSYYDSDKYLRYNKSIDENSVGDLYAENYAAMDKTEGVAYLKYVEGADQTVFADYSYSEKTVPAKTSDDSSNDSDSSDNEDTTESETNPWLLASSIAVAAVLVLAIGSIGVQKLLKSLRKKGVIKPRTSKNKKNDK